MADNAYLVPLVLSKVIDTGATSLPEQEGHLDSGQLSGMDPSTTARATGVPSPTFLHCPVCNLRVDNRSQLVGHIRGMRDLHKEALVGTSPTYQLLRGLNVMPCPL